MYVSELAFSLELGWQQTIFNQLKELCISYNWKDGKCTWCFPYSRIKDVEILVGKPISIEGYRDKFEIEKTTPESWKGESGFKIVEYPKIYRVIEFRKVETNVGEGEVKELKHDVSKELVSVIWKHIISIMPMNKAIKSSTISENICNFLYLSRFFREGGSFDSSKFFGERKDYFTYFYYPMKVLSWQGKIIHHKRGMIERISN